jgi:hypothetical protein
MMNKLITRKQTDNSEQEKQTKESSAGNQKRPRSKKLFAVPCSLLIVPCYLLICCAFAWTQPAPSPETIQEDKPASEVVSPEKPKGGHFSIGLGIEANNNNSSGAALGVALGADYRLFRFFALGIKQGFSSNFGNSNTIETAVFARLPITIKGIDLFVQGALGISHVITYHDNETRFLFEGGAGARVPVKSFYIEPQVRFGSPFLMGAGITFGYSFQGKR